MSDEARVVYEEDGPVVFVPEPDPVTPKRKKVLSLWQQVERNLAIVERRARGDSWEDIANEHGVTIKRAKLIMAEYRRENPSLRNLLPVEIVDELLEGYSADLRALNETYDAAVLCANINGRVGAINSRMAARARIAELLQAIGVLPHDLGTMHLVIEGQVMAEKVFSVLERYDLPEDLFRELEEALDESGLTDVEMPALPAP